MSEGGREPYIARATVDVPKRWYQHAPGAQLATFALTGVAVYFQEKYLPVGSLAEHAAGLAVYGTGVVADLKSTRRGIAGIEAAEDAGIETPLRELNPLIGDVREVADFDKVLRSTGTWIREGVGIGIAAAFPIGGLAIGASRLSAAFNNNRSAQLLERATELKNDSLQLNSSPLR